MEMSKCATIDDFVKFAKENPHVPIDEVFHWATNEVGCGETIDVVKAFLAAGQMDIDEIARWPNDSHGMTTLLLSAAEFRDDELLSGLLELGANVDATCERACGGFGVIDTIILGHNPQCNKDTCKRVNKCLDAILPYKPSMVMKPFVKQSFHGNEWPGFKKDERIAKFVNECVVMTV